MGVVYRARDTELRRDVALKVLPDSASADPRRIERFDREIRTVARLSHPNIVELYDFGTAEESSYAVMELLKGCTLRELMHGRPLSVDRVLQIGIAVARGLGAAHRQGVLHRDIKPGNIFVTSDGGTKILDFGLARCLEAPSDPDAETRSVDQELTSPGAVVGTTLYMSPEQVRGLALDPRSDIFSLGCVLYEMISGGHPFLRETRADTMSAILSHHQPPLTQARPDLPPALELIVARCLEKDPEDRFESALDVAFAMDALSEGRAAFHVEQPASVRVPRRVIRWVEGLGVTALVAVLLVLAADRLVPPQLPDQRHVAVTRFQATVDEPVLHELADALTETVSAGLETVAEQSRGAMWVVPRQMMTSAEEDTLADLRRRFAVNLGVGGNLQRNGSRLRLHLVVVDPGSGDTIREAVIEDSMDNLSSFQRDPVLRVAQLLGAEVAPETAARLTARSTNHVKAFSSYIQAIGLLFPPYDHPDHERAQELLKEALGADPGFAPAREALAAHYLARFEETGDSTWIAKGTSAVDEIMRRSPTVPAYLVASRLRQAAGDNAAAADLLSGAARSFPDCAELYIALGRACQAAGRDSEAERAYQHATNLRPGYWVGHHRLAMLDFVRGRYDAAANELRAVIGCAPDYDGGYTNLGMVYYQLDRSDDAREMFERAVELTGGADFVVLSNLGTLYFEQSRFAEAASLFERALALDDRNHTVWGNLGEAYAATLDPEKAERPFRRAIELADQERQRGAAGPDILSDLASYHAMLGEKDASMGLLDEAIALRPSDPNVIAVIGESFEDLGERSRALEWVGRALAAGVPASRFEHRPSLRGLVDDPRFQTLVSQPSKNKP